MDRLEDARRLANTNPRDTFVSPNLWQAHMHELLETIEHLQRENERIKTLYLDLLKQYEIAEQQINSEWGTDIQRDNRELGEEINRLRATLDLPQSDTLT